MDKRGKIIKAMVNRAFLDPDMYKLVVPQYGDIEVWYNDYHITVDHKQG